MQDIHTALGILCCQLQKENLIFSDAKPMIDSTTSKLGFLKTSDGNALAEMKALIIINDKAFYKGNMLKNFSKEVDPQFESVRQDYLSNKIKIIKKRIPNHDC